MSAMRVLLSCLAAATLQGCLLQENFADAEQSVSLFHDRLNSEAYEEIWELTAPVFHGPQMRDDARAIFSAMHARLGPALHSEKVDASGLASSGEGATVTLVYQTRFARGSATETFVFMVDSGKPLIWNYNISSRTFSGADVQDHQRLADSS